MLSNDVTLKATSGSPAGSENALTGMENRCGLKSACSTLGASRRGEIDYVRLRLRPQGQGVGSWGKPELGSSWSLIAPPYFVTKGVLRLSVSMEAHTGRQS